MTRGDLVESLHYGLVLVLDPDGNRVLSLGDVDAPLLPRSSVKPLQAAAMLEAGLEPQDERLLALAASSHSGEQWHLDGVLEILRVAGLGLDALANTPDLPLGDAAREDYLRAGGTADALHQNCSGKHSSMLATCVANGWPIAGYLDAAHPLQAAIRAFLERHAGPVTGVEVDGCGAPLFAMSAVSLACGFAALGRGATPSLRRVTEAMRAFPTYVGGTGRDVTALMGSVPGLVAKDGAEGVYAAATADGGAVVLKISDGTVRARVPVLARALRALGVEVPAAVYAAPVLGGGHPVGEVRAAFPLTAS